MATSPELNFDAYHDVWSYAKAVTDLAAALLLMWMIKLVLDAVSVTWDLSRNDNRIRNLINEDDQSNRALSGIKPTSYITINLQHSYNPSIYDGDDEISLRRRSRDTTDSGRYSNDLNSVSSDGDDDPSLFSPDDFCNLLDMELSFFTDINWTVVLNVSKTSGFSEAKICSMCALVSKDVEEPMPIMPSLPVISVTSISVYNPIDGKPPYTDTNERILCALYTHWMNRCFVRVKNEKPIEL